MVFWMLAIAVTVIACAALYYAFTSAPVNATALPGDDRSRHFRLALAEIEADRVSGKLGAGEAHAARKELARELVRHDGSHAVAPEKAMGRGPVLGGLVVLILGTLALYSWLGRPDVPGLPLTQRPEILAQNMELDAAIVQIEAQLAQQPDDLRGWRAIAPAYIEMQRFADAERAFRRIIALAGATADSQTDLAEALILANDGNASGEAMTLLRAAAEGDPIHQRSRFYIAGELTRAGEYAAAASAWQDLIALSDGTEGWLARAREGLAFAQSEGVTTPAVAPDADAIAEMVEGLSSRLAAEGGTVEEWTRLVRSYIVLDQSDRAQAAYDDAVSAYPRTFDRGELDTIALAAGLTLNGAQQ